MQLLNAKHNPLGEPLLLVDQIPPLERLRFRKLRVDDPTGPGYLYVAEQDGYVAFFFQYDPNHFGYGQGLVDREFHLHLDDGTAETLVGPWRSSTYEVNRYLPELAVRGALLTDDRRTFEDAALTDDELGFDAAVDRTVRGAITTQLWCEIPDRVRSAEKQARQPVLQPANPGRLGVEQIAQITATAIQRLARVADDRVPEESIIDRLPEERIIEEVVSAVEATVVGVPPRPDVDIPDVVPGRVATDTVHEYLRVRQSWGWPTGRASAWAVGAVADRHRTFERVDAAAVDTTWAVSERQQAADYDRLLDLQNDLSDRDEASWAVWEAQDVEPWLPTDVDALLAAAPPPDTIPTELAERARTKKTGELLAWVDEARRPPERPLRLDYGGALHTEAQARHHRDEERLVLEGLGERLNQAGPRWWPGTWRRRADLRARIAEHTRVVLELDQRVKQAEDRVLASLPPTRTAEDAWEGRVLERAVAAAQELRLREQGLLDDRVIDPPEQLLQALGPPPADPAGWQAWRGRALHLQRARAAGETTVPTWPDDGKVEIQPDTAVERETRIIDHLRGLGDVREIEHIGNADPSYSEVKATAAADPGPVGGQIAEYEQLNQELGRNAAEDGRPGGPDFEIDLP